MSAPPRMEPETVSITPDTLPPRDAYRLTTSVVVPRPIAWISTIGEAGVTNLAPYSFFNAVAGAPPTIMVSIGEREGEPKDTLRNLRATGEMVVHLADEALAEALNVTSGDFARGVSEFERAGLASLSSVDVRPPRVAAAPVAMEARLLQETRIAGSHYTVVFVQVVRFHIRRDLLGEDALVLADRLRPICRLGRDEYAPLGEVFRMERPRV